MRRVIRFVCTVWVTSGPAGLHPRGQQQDTLIPAVHGLGALSAAEARGRDHSFRGVASHAQGTSQKAQENLSWSKYLSLSRERDPNQQGVRKGFLKAI